MNIFHKNLLVRKGLTFLLLLSMVTTIFFGLGTKKANAQWLVLDLANFGVNLSTAITSTISAAADVEILAKEFGILGIPGLSFDAIAYFIMKIVIQQITAQTVNWINSGFAGQPGFVTDPGQFFGQLGDKVAGTFIEGLAPQLCSPFNLQVRLALVNNQIREFQSQCTFTEALGNLDTFTKDFYESGWDGWFVMTQNSQNNPFGAYLDTQYELTSRLSTSQGQIQDQLSQGRGFLSWGEKCISPGLPVKEINKDTGEPTGKVIPGDDPSNCLKTAVSTPGSVIENQLANTFGSGVRQLELADEMNEIVTALIIQLTKQLIGGVGKGLRSLVSGGSDSYVSQLSAQATLLEAQTKRSQELVEQTTAENRSEIEAEAARAREEAGVAAGSGGSGGFCGDGIVGFVEQCDEGSNNGAPGFSCSTSCTII